MGRILAFLIFVGAVRGQEPDFQAKVRAAMSASLNKQKESVHAQTIAAQQIAPTAAASEPGFFTVPWPVPVSMNVSQASGIDCEPMPKEQLESLVGAAAEKEGLKTDLIHAVIRKESASRPCAISPKGAQGLMQLMPATADELGVTDAFDPKQNIEGGAKLLKQLLTKYKGDLALTLGAYNAGSGRVDKEAGIPRIPETVNYVSDILKEISNK